MRIVIVTQDEPFYLPAFFKHLVAARKSDIAAIVNLQPFNEKFSASVRRAFDLYGFWDFLRYGARFSFIKGLNILSRILPLGGPWSVLDVARRENIPVYTPASINDPAFRAVLADTLRPDLIVSVAASQIFKKDVLAIAPKGCINIHSAPLPRYQGMFPSFWAMYHSEPETAVTVHYMTPKLDDGDIIRQEAVKIEAGMSLETLIRVSKRIGVDVLLAAIDDIEHDRVQARPMDLAEATYFTFPTRAEAKKFRAMGKRFM